MKKWIGTIKNNNIVMENDFAWDHIKSELKSLYIDNNGQKIILPDNMDYIQGKTASALIGSNNVSIESRYIGVYKNNLKIVIRIDEKTNDIKLEITEQK